ncbi:MULTISPECIES: hypothetical protein [Vibrio]|uniref:O-succinylbenzoic acid--CoA ligase n=1 Tax=Vibrio cortegadensis TaxID=1328770 RepID=A0ABV4M1Z1_9VIBR|nr:MULTISPECIES: hypothetical protein [Vibrio]MDN3698670.1 hypothetical protein [Vibrio cortegadensis]
MKIIILVAIVLQITLAIQSEGLVRSIAELTAFLLVASLVLNYKQSAQTSSAQQ